MAHVAKRFIIPEDLARAATKEGREEWLAELPALVAWATASWQIEVADPFHPGGETAWVAPARDHTGKGSVLKVCWPHPEAAHEAEGLRSWGGAGAVACTGRTGFALLAEDGRPGPDARSFLKASQEERRR
jgi:streptomycin 6-kinase